MTDDFEAVKAEAVASLRAALISEAGVESALRQAFYRNPEFAMALFVGSLHRWFGRDSDVRSVTALTARIKAERTGDPLGFPARQAETLIRVALGETDLWPELDWARFNYLEMFIAVLQELFKEWRAAAGELDDLFTSTREAVAYGRELAPELAPEFGPALQDWFRTGMHQSPFIGMNSTIAPPTRAYNDPEPGDLACGNGGHRPSPQNEQVMATQRGVDQALADCDAAIACDPCNAKLFADRGTAYNARDRHTEALADYNRAVQLDPHDASALAGRASTLNLMGRHDKALSDYNRAIDFAPGSSEAFEGRGDTYLMLGRYGEALADFDRAAELDPASAWAFTGRGQAYRAMERYDAALADLTHAIELAPANPWMIGTRAEVRQAMGMHEQALTGFSQAIELDPAAEWALAARGDSYQALGRYKEAIADYSRAIELDPTALWPVCSRGDTYRMLHRYEDAIADYDLVMKQDSEDVDAIAGRGLTYWAMGRYHDAATDFRRVIEIEPDLRSDFEQYLSPPSGLDIDQRD